MLVKTLILEMSESRLPNPKNWIIAKSRFFVPGKNGSKYRTKTSCACGCKGEDA